MVIINAMPTAMAMANDKKRNAFQLGVLRLAKYTLMTPPNKSR